MVAKLARKEEMVAENKEKRTYTVEEVKEIFGDQPPYCVQPFKKTY